MEDSSAPATRALRRRAGGLSAADLSPRLLAVRALGVLALAGLVVLAGWAHPLALAAAFVWACLGLGWGWSEVFAIRPGRRVLVVLALAGVVVAVAVVLSDGETRLRLVPITLAGAVVVVFLLQLMRTDGRPGLTHEVVATVGGLAFVGLGAGLVPLASLDVGRPALTVAMAGVAVSLVADAVSARLGPSPWALLLTFALGGLVGGLLGQGMGLPVWWHGVTVGAVCALLSYAVRRVIEVVPGSHSLAGQVAGACASILAVGVLAEVLARVVLVVLA